MEWCNFNIKEFPNVIVTFNRNLIDLNDFNELTSKWLLLINDSDKNYNLIIDTNNLGKFNLSYVLKLKKFLSEIKKLPYNNLNWSIIIVSNNFIKYVINLIFKFQKPISTVYLIRNNNNINHFNLINNVNNNNFDDFKIILV